jgi:hypothetical protein
MKTFKEFLLEGYVASYRGTKLISTIHSDVREQEKKC